MQRFAGNLCSFKERATTMVRTLSSRDTRRSSSGFVARSGLLEVSSVVAHAGITPSGLDATCSAASEVFLLESSFSSQQAVLKGADSPMLHWFLAETSLFDSRIHAFIRLFIRSLVHACMHTNIHSFVRPCRIYSCMHAFIRSKVCSLID